jgi:hypothetical protein
MLCSFIGLPGAFCVPYHRDRRLASGSRFYQAAAFFDPNEPAGFEIAGLVHLAARPADFNGAD